MRVRTIGDWLKHPALILLAAGIATGVFVQAFTPWPPFAGAGRFFLLYYHAPIGFVFVLYLFERAARWRWLPWRQWALEPVVVFLALARAVWPVPFISGHALFLTYLWFTANTRLTRWAAALVLVEVAALKVFLLHDPTLVGGILAGVLAARLVRQRGRR